MLHSKSDSAIHRCYTGILWIWYCQSFGGTLILLRSWLVSHAAAAVRTSGHFWATGWDFVRWSVIKIVCNKKLIFGKILAMFLMFRSFVWKLSSIILERLGAVHTYSRSPQWQTNYEAGRIQALCTHIVVLLNAQKAHHKCVPEPHQDSWRGTCGFSP